MNSAVRTAMLSFFLTAVLVEITPGPNMATLAAIAVAYGRSAGFAMVGGVALGLAIVGVAAALGLTAIITASPVLHDLLRYGGALFLLYLAWDAWRDATADEEPKRSFAGYFGRGLVTNLLNPKAAAFYVAVLPAFLTPGPQELQQSLMLVAIYVAVATAIHAGIVAAASAAGDFLHGPTERLVRRALALLLAAVAVWFFLSTGQ